MKNSFKYKLPTGKGALLWTDTWKIKKDCKQAADKHSRNRWKASNLKINNGKHSHYKSSWKHSRHNHWLKPLKCNEPANIYSKM